MSITILPYKNIYPKIDKSVLLCDGVRIIGDVEIGKDCSVWYNSVIRGDVNYIRIGERTNIQDISMLHVTKEKFPLIVGNGVSVAHSVALHGAVLEDNILLGIGAIILDGSLIRSNSIVAAGALVKEGFEVPEGVLMAGVPAKIIRDLKPEEIDRIKLNADHYVDYAIEFKKNVYKTEH
ncbi:MAG: gamma carbonic anhydrase family protein [Ignavibacteria bacterium]|jgi:carbonic anhydrase/acetyltransferase-like protein (isoleucine patch superfamily)|nr:gamma carbonic anhydrase family protein [Ignavibacteria bacterium]